MQIVSLVAVAVCFAYSASAQVCYSQNSYYSSVVYYTPGLYYYRTSSTYYYSCGFFGWGRCSSTGYNRRSGYRETAVYRAQIQYRQTSSCCSGYAGTAPNCSPVCSVCYNGGTCTAPELCSCTVGWTGSDCNTDIDECTASTDGCDHICMNTPGSYTCSCNNAGYSLNANGLTCDDVNECEIAELGGRCTQVCVNTLGSYNCQCNSGYRLQGDGITCEDIDECLDNNGGCNHECINNEGSHECSCRQGYFLSDDQRTCVDHDECLAGDHSCTQICNNLPGAHECVCNTGYELLDDGYTCVDINECELGYCNHICNNSEGSFTCSCEDGYALEDDNRTCFDIDECAIDNGGCDHFCSNYPGFYRCSCRDGYTLEEDGGCTAQPCPNLMRPQNGDINCTGLQVTDQNCTFSCDPGYQLFGSSHHQCLPDNTWRGVPVTCSILSCPALTEPLNGAIILPCEYEFRSTCTLRCDDGFYSDDILTQSCVLSADDSYVEWTAAPVCNAIRACEPYPCRYSGVCTALGPREFECDCTGTGYEGDMCQYGIVELPDYPTLIAEGPSQMLSISARPAAFIIIEFVADDEDNLIFDPPSVIIHYPNTSANFTILSTAPNLYTVNYVITGMSSDEFPAPDPSTVLVTSQNSAPPNSYFTDRNVPIGLLQPGCCQPVNTAPSYQCPNGVIDFNATCNWRERDDMHFVPGIVFTSLNGLTLPASISGTELEHSDNVVSLNQLNIADLNEPCAECMSLAMGNETVPNVGSEFVPSCSFPFSPAINDISNFLNAESLAYSYFHYANSLYPSWVKLQPINGNSRTHDTNSYQVRLVDSSELNEINGCEDLPVIEAGLYSVLQYSGTLNISIPSIGTHNIYTPSDDATPLCFAINLCAGSRAPFYIGIPTEVQPFFSDLPFIQNLTERGWIINTKALTFGVGDVSLNVDITDRLSGVQYWNGIEDITANDHFYAVSLAVRGTVDRNFTKEDLLCVLEFEGLSYMQYYNLNEAYNTGLLRRWVGALDGDIDLTVQIFVQGQSSKLVLEAEETPALFFFGDYREGCTAPSGLSLMLNYMPSTDNSGLLSTTFRVPPNPIFGLPTQFSCPIDTFVTLDDNMRMRGVQLRSQCVDINIGRFQFNGISLVHTLNIVGNANDFNIICVTGDLITPDTRVLMETKFTSNYDTLPLGYFMTLRPDDNLNAVTIAFFKDDATFVGKMHVVDFMLLGTRFTTEVEINEDGLQFSVNCNMFDRYPIQLTGRADQNSVWNGLPIELSGYFGMSQTNLPYLLQAEIHEYVSFIARRARLSEQSARMALQRARDQFEYASSTYNTRLQDYEAVYREYNESMAELLNATTERSAAQEAVDLAEEVLQESRERIDNLCEIEVCNDICVPGTVCSECTAAISSTVQGTCLLPCELTENVQMYVGVRAYSCWRWINVLQCVYLCYCPSWSICVAGRACRYTSVCARTTCFEDIYITVPITYIGTCVEQCDTGIMTTDVVEQCCVLSECASLVPNNTCTQLNSQCQMARDVAYAQLSRSEASAYEPLERLDAARQRASRAQINVARLTSEKNIAEQLLNQSTTAFRSSQKSIGFAELVYELLVEQLNQSLILADILNESTQHVVQVNEVTFTTTLITESPTTIPVLVNYSFPMVGTSHLEEIILDFEYIDSSILQRAIELTNAAFNMLNRRRKRQTNDDTITQQRDIDRNAMYYGERCTDAKNLQEYMSELVASLEVIRNVSATSKDAVMDNVMALGNLSTASMNNNASSPVNYTYLEMEFGATINMSDPMSTGNDAITDLLNDLQELTLQLAGSIGENSFQEWQVRMEDLHNQTESAAGQFCFGFTDCLLTVGEVTGNLLRLTPLTEATELLFDLLEAERDLLDLTLLTNLTIDEAISKTEKFTNLLEEFSQLNYWCASIPNITVQPEERVTSLENDTVILTCETDSLVPVNYRWKKGSAGVPDAKNNSLVIENIKFSDAENYTCIATNHIGSVTSTNSSVEVQELPAYFLQPDHQDIYLRDQNGAQFKCNATGAPYPGFRWYYRPHNEADFTVVEGEDENEYTIPNTVPEHEGVYYCEAYNEQGAVQSRQVNLTVLGTTVAQLAQYFTFNISAVTNGSYDDIIDEASNLTFGSGMSNSPHDILIQHIVSIVSDSIDIRRTTIENVTIATLEDAVLSVTLGLYSYNISYSGVSSNDLLLIGPEARSEWGMVLSELLTLLQEEEEIIASDGNEAYQIISSSLLFGDVQLACPQGSAVYEENQFLCVNCPAGSYQINRRITELNDDGSETVVIMPECVECPIGSYQYVQGQIECTACPDYHTTRRTSTRLPEDCIMLCPPGEYSIDGLAPCSRCPTGEYQSTHGQVQCVTCPDYHSTQSEGSYQSDDCVLLCLPGQYSTDGFGPCDSCPCGSYSVMYGAIECSNCSISGAPRDQCNETCPTSGSGTDPGTETDNKPVVAIAAGVGGGVAAIIIIVLVVVIFIVILRKRGRQDDHERLIKKRNDDGNEDTWDKKRHFKYNFSKAAEDFTAKHLKENEIDEEFAEGAVVNPVYSPEGNVTENPAYLNPN